MRWLWVTSAVGFIAVTACSSPLEPSAFASGDDGLKTVATGGFAVAGDASSLSFEGPLFSPCTMSTQRISCVAVASGDPVAFMRIEVTDGGGVATRSPSTEQDVHDAPSNLPHLDKGNKLVLDGGRAVCGTVNSYTIACRLGEHGFKYAGSDELELY